MCLYAQNNITFMYKGELYTGIQIVPTDSIHLDVLGQDLDSLFISIYWDCKEIIISDKTDICLVITRTYEEEAIRFINVRQRKGEFSFDFYLGNISLDTKR